MQFSPKAGHQYLHDSSTQEILDSSQYPLGHQQKHGKERCLPISQKEHEMHHPNCGCCRHAARLNVALPPVQYRPPTAAA